MQEEQEQHTEAPATGSAGGDSAQPIAPEPAAEADAARTAANGVGDAISDARRSSLDVLAEDVRRISGEAREASLRASKAEAVARKAIEERMAVSASPKRARPSPARPRMPRLPRPSRR